MGRDWDAHYGDAGNVDWTPEPLLVEATELVRAGRALDIACGAGRNTLYLAKLGWRVTAVDRSAAALRLLRQRAAGLDLEILQADLEKGDFKIEADSYDLICDFLYLQRDLFPSIRAGVRPGGLFAGAVLLKQPGHEERFRMDPGELRQEFAGWKVLYYSEAGAARILARKA